MLRERWDVRKKRGDVGRIVWGERRKRGKVCKARGWREEGW